MGIKIGLTALYLCLFAFLLIQRKQMIFYSGLLLYSLASFVSLILIENGAYILEQNRFGFENGAFYYFYVYTLLTLFVFFMTCGFIPSKIKYIRSGVPYYIISVVYLGLVFYAKSINPDANRFGLLEVFGPTGKRFFSIFLTSYFMFFIFFCYKAESVFRKFVYFVIYALLQLLRGDQLGGVLEGIVVFTIAAYLHQSETAEGQRARTVRQKWPLILCIALLCAGIVGYKINRLEQWDKFVTRAVLQGHVFWGVLEESKLELHPPNGAGVVRNLFAWRTSSVNEDIGLGKMMVLLSGDYAIGLMEGGGRFTGGYPAILIGYYGFWPAMAINGVATMLYVLCLVFMIYFLNRYNWLVFLLAMKVIYAYTSEFYGMGEYVQFNIKYWIGFCLILSVVIVTECTKTSKRKSLKGGCLK